MRSSRTARRRPPGRTRHGAAPPRQTLGDPGPLEQGDRALFQHAGPDASQHVFRCLDLKDYGVDFGVVQQLAENQPGRAGADYCDLSFGLGGGHVLPPIFSSSNVSVPQQRLRRLDGGWGAIGVAEIYASRA